LPNQEAQHTEKEEGPRFPWRDLGSWFVHWLKKLWSGIRSVWRQLKAIPPYRRNTYLAILGMIILLLLGGAVIGLVIRSVGIGILFVSLVTAIWLAVIYFKGNSILPLLAGAKPVKEGERPKLVSMMQALSQTAELPMPSFWIAENSEVNAFACGRDSEHAAVVVYTGGLDIWEGEEIKGILAHEIAHIKNKDVLLDTFMRAILNGMQWSAVLFMKPIEWGVEFFGRFVSEDSESIFSTVLGIMVLMFSWLLRVLDFVFGVILLSATHLIQMAASRQQEYYADATGAKLAGSSHGLASALAKLQVMEQSLSSASPQKGRGVQGVMEQLWSTHPPTEERVRRLGGTLFAAGSKEADEILSGIEATQEPSEARYDETASVPLRITQMAKRVSVNEKGGNVEYRVIPVNLNVVMDQGSPGASKQVEKIINQETARGWEFVSLENIELVVTDPGNKGCFGIGATPQTNKITRFDMAVFRK